MGSMKRVHPALLVLVVAALLAAGAAPAVGSGCKLTPPPGSDEPTASGAAQLGKLEVYPHYYLGWLRVTCHGLTPGATCEVSLGSLFGAELSGQFTADAHGDGTTEVPLIVPRGGLWDGSSWKSPCIASTATPVSKCSKGVCS